MEKMKTKKLRIQLNERELWILRNLLAQHYHCDRRNILWEKRRIKRGQPESRVYSIAEMQKHLKEDAKLLRKLSRHLDVRWFER